MNLGAFNPQKKVSARFVKAGGLGKVIGKDVCVNKHALSLLYLMEVQFLDLFRKEFRLKGDYVHSLAVLGRDHAVCGEATLSASSDDKMDSFMLSNSNVENRFEKAVFIYCINMFLHKPLLDKKDSIKTLKKQKEI